MHDVEAVREIEQNTLNSNGYDLFGREEVGR